MRTWSQGRAQRLAMLVDGTLWVRFRFWRLGLTTARVAWREVVRLDQTFRFGLPMVLIAILMFFAVHWFRSATPDAQQSVVGDLTVDNVVPRYHAWRYLKTNSTATDIHRALVNLAVGLQLDIPVCPESAADGQATANRGAGYPEKDPIARCPDDEQSEKDPKKIEQKQLRLAEERARGRYSKQIMSILQRKELTIALADDLLKTVFAGRLERGDLPTACAAVKILPPGLRSPNVEIRNLLKRALNEVSASLWGPVTAEDPLPDNDVGPDADTVGIEVAVVKWSDFIGSHCAARAPTKKDPVVSKTSPEPDAPIVLSSDLNFEFNSAELRDAAAAELTRVAAQFRDHEHLTAEIRGYTDSVGAAAYNLRLSEHRARSVKDYLVAQGVRDEALRTKGFGAEKPVDRNDTRQGRAKNRRVEIQLQPPPPAYGA